MLIVLHDEFNGDNGLLIEFYANQLWFKIMRDGPPEQFFQDAVDERGPRRNRNEVPAAPAEDKGEINPEILRMHNITRLDDDDVALASNFIETDDNNDLALENVPLNSLPPDNIFSENWGHGGIDLRRAEGIRNVRASINSGRMSSLTRQQLFEFMMPTSFVQKNFIPKMNERFLVPIT
jgi:hypothetical protein